MSETNMELFSIIPHLVFLIFLPILWDVDGNWWWNDLNDVAMRIFLMEKILITLIPWSSLSFLDIGKWFFVIRWSFLYWMTLEWRRWCWNDFFSSWDDGWMTEMRVEWGIFWRKANALDFFSLSFHSHSYYIYHLTLIQCLKWTWNGFQSFHTQFCTILMSSHHSSVIPSFRVHFNVIHKFCCLSIIPHSFPCHSIILISFLPFYSYSIVIQDILQSFCHSHIICHHSVSPPCPCPKV